MGVQQDQWEEAYFIAERMFTSSSAEKRTQLNCFQQIVCSRYSTIFEYDPYKDAYRFINQELKFEQPVPSRCRTVAEADLDVLKNNAVKSELKSPAYVNITPIYVVPPSTILVFNNSQAPSDELNNALLNATTTLTLTPTEAEVTPGAEFVFKHKNGKCYRCLIISELSDKEVPESERRYEVAFLDHCQIVPVKLKTLFIPGELTMENYPCALQCIRPIGVVAFRNGFVADYNNDVRAFYNDRNKRKSGLVGLLYKTNKTEKKLIMDFPSIHGHPYTNAEEIKMQHGHQQAALKDPVGLKYEQLINQEIVESLEYDEDGEDDEKGVAKEPAKKEDVKEDDDDDVLLDLSDSDRNTDNGSLSIMKEVQNAECPLGMASIQRFMQQGRQPMQMAVPLPTRSTANPSTDISFISSFHPAPPQQEPQSNQEETAPLDTTCNESVSSLRSATINQTASSNPTPQPTFDEPLKIEMTPKKNDSGHGSSDGWGEDTPKKREEANEETTSKKLGFGEFAKSSNSVRVSSDSTMIAVFPSSKPQQEVMTQVPVPERSQSPASIQRPLTPTPQFEHRQPEQNLRRGPSPLMSKIIATPEKFKSNETEAKPSKVPDVDVNGSIQALPSVAAIIKTDNRSHVFGQPPNSTEIDCSPKSFGSHPHDQNVSEKDLSVSRVVTKPRKQSTLEDDVFNSTNYGESSETMIQRFDNTSVCQDADTSKTSTNQRLISTAQDNFHDDDDDEWGLPQDAQSQPIQCNTPGKVIEIEGQMITIFPTGTSVESAPDDNFSRKSICSGDLNDNAGNSPEWDCEANSTTVIAVDEFADVADNFKQLASAFLCSIREAAIQKNHNVYMIEIMAFEVMSQKMPSELDKRFMRAKLGEAKSLDQAFD